MARVTVEDCIKIIPNTFELVLFAGQRARELGTGEPPAVATEGEKKTVIALREIAAGRLDPERLRDNLIRGLQRIQPEEEAPPEDEFDELVADFGGLPGFGVTIDDVDEPEMEIAEPGADDALAEEEAAMEDR